MFDNEFLQTRRAFLTRLSTAMAGVGVLTAAPWSSSLVSSALADPATEALDKVRIGVIGVGSRGRRLLLVMQKARNIEITAVCDNYEPHYQRALALTDGKASAYRDYRALLDDRKVDAVVIATPLNHHDYITIDALSAGYPVFCEKAMSRTLEGCKAMLDAQQASNGILQIGHQRLFDPVYLEALNQVQNGELGKVTQIRAYWHRNNDWRNPVPPGSGLERQLNWRLYKESSGGLMTELASHQLQVANWFFNDLPERIMGSGSICYWRDGRDVYDQVGLVFDYPDGRKLIYDSMLNNRLYGIEEQILGDKGTMELRTNKRFSEIPEPVPGLQRLISDTVGGLFQTLPIGGASWAAETRENKEGRPIKDGDYHEELLQMEAFAESVKNGTPLPGVLREGYHASIAALLGEQAMDSGQPVTWPKQYIMPKAKHGGA